MSPDRTLQKQMVKASAAPARPGGALVELHGVGASFGGVVALQDVTTEIRAGEMVAVVGPNGAGKTTLLNSISGLLRGSLRGRIVLGGKETTHLTPQSIARLGVGRSFQDPRLIDEESALENVLCGAHTIRGPGAISQIFRPFASGRAERSLVDRAMRILEILGTDDVARLRVADLSYGHRKLIDIGRALMAEPHLLLLDEPSSGLDEHEQKSIVRILRAVHESEPGLAMVLVEHHMPLVSDVATRILAMQTGAILLDDTPEAVMNSSEFKAALVGRVTEEQVPAEGQAN